jgi:hypothetical protein
MEHCLLSNNRLPALAMEDADRILDALGPMPAKVLAAMVDYGLSDTEIGRYYDLPDDMVATLRDAWGLDGNP